MTIEFVTRCSSCGDPIPFIDAASAATDMDRSHCDNCNDRFYEAMAAEFPYGQCGQCGGAGRLLLCPNGKQHVVTDHVEGACSNWSDVVELFSYDGCGICGSGPVEIIPLPPAGWDDSPF